MHILSFSLLSIVFIFWARLVGTSPDRNRLGEIRLKVSSGNLSASSCLASHTQNHLREKWYGSALVFWLVCLCRFSFSDEVEKPRYTCVHRSSVLPRVYGGETLCLPSVSSTCVIEPVFGSVAEVCFYVKTLARNLSLPWSSDCS